MYKKLVMIDVMITLFVNAPIWYYLIYTILQAIHPDRLIWFLFWMYVPIGIFSRILVCIYSNLEKK